MYRITGSNNCSSHNLTCKCDDLDGEASMSKEPLPGLKIFPGLKRKYWPVLQENCLENNFHPSEMRNSITNCKRMKQKRQQKLVKSGENPQANASDEGLNTVKVSSLNCPCAVEGCLSKGFSGLFSSPRMQNQEQRTWS